MNCVEDNFDKVFRDKITGFEGTCVAITYYANGNVKYGLDSELIDVNGIPMGTQWIDAYRIEKPSSKKKMGYEN